MMARDIANITFELARIHEDRLLMKWEDDRAHLLGEVERLQRKIKKQLRTINIVRQEQQEVGRLAMAAERTISAQCDLQTSKKRLKLSVASAMSSNEIHGNSDIKKSESGQRPRNEQDIVEYSVGHGKNILSSSSSSGIFLKLDGGRAQLETLDMNKGSINTILGGKKRLKPTHDGRKGASDARDKVVEVVRNKEERDALPGYSCVECERYISVMRLQGMLQSEDEVSEMLQRCSRHKSAAGPPSATPEGFWDLTVQTPDEWKRQPLPPPHVWKE